MTGRKCSTCKHYEPAPIWRKGWCRNPLLFSAQQSHLVGEDDLDCERGMGNYWDPIDPSAAVPLGDDGENRASYAAAPLAGQQLSPPWITSSGQPIFAVSGSSGYNDPPPSEPPNGGRGMTPPGRERQIDYYEEERYWTDYLRIALPIVGVILLLVVFYIWANSFLGGDDDDGGTGAATSTGTLPTISASPRSSPTGAALGTPSVPVIRTITVTPPPETGEATETPGGEVPTEPPISGSDTYNGATVQVANTGGEGANLRSDASTAADVVAVLLDGTQLTVIDERVDADGYGWWHVSGTTADGAAVEGWIVQDFLELVS